MTLELIRDCSILYEFINADELDYLPLVDEALIMNNSPEESSKRLIARKNINHSFEVFNKPIWKKIEEIANEWLC